MPRLADVVAGRARYQPFAISAATPNASVTEPTPQRVKRKHQMRKLTAPERRTFLDAFGPVLSLQQAAGILGIRPLTLKRQVSEGKYANCVKRGKPLRFITDRFTQEAFGGVCE